MYNKHLSNKKLVIRIKDLEISMHSVFILAIVIYKEFAKIKAGFFAILYTNLNNTLFYCNYNI